MKAVKVENLTKSYGAIKALNGVSFEVERGEVFGLLGPNGAGKTTTVRILTGIIKPDRGMVKVMGIDVLKDAIKAKERIGVLPEVSNAYPDLTAWQNLMLVASLYGMKKRDAEKEASRLLKDFSIFERKNSKVKGFSKGMRQRLMFCMALIGNPDVVFLDEPTSGLDVQSARMIRSRILDLAAEGKTILLASHNMDEVNQLCNRVAIMSKGRIMVMDTPEKIKAKVGGSVAVEVSFDRDVKLKAEKLGDKYVIYTTNPHKVICELISFAEKENAKVISINTRTPSLEDAFLKVVEVSQ